MKKLCCTSHVTIRNAVACTSSLIICGLSDILDLSKLILMSLAKALLKSFPALALPGLALWCSLPLFAADSFKSIIAVRTETPPVMDGRVNEPQWQTAPAVLDFTQFDPVEGALPTELTSVRVLYTDHALYFGVICYDSRPKSIVGQLTRRDRSTEADRFTVQIDSYHDHSTAFVFSTNVTGVQSDGILSQNGLVYDVTWDALWECKTSVYVDGWSAEFEIPFNALRFSEKRGEPYEWGINFRRYISRKHETDEWVMIPRTERLLISCTTMGRGLFVTPYFPRAWPQGSEPSSNCTGW